jgi:ferritin-like metal-binding protein YciE
MKSSHSSHLVTPRDVQGFRELFAEALKEIYWTEKTLLRAIPDMIQKAGTDSLTHTLTDHLEATREHVNRLEEVFLIVGEKIKDKKCDAMAGLVREAEKIMLATDEGLVREAAIISSVQKIVHYEIACYGTLCAFAKALEEKEAASLLHFTLEEEKEADELLSEIAESMQMEIVDNFDDYIDLSDSVRNKKGSPADFR